MRFGMMSFLLFHTLAVAKLSKGKIPSIKALSPNYSPTTSNQKLYVNALTNPDTHIVLGVGPAGTGKTLFACNRAVELLKAGSIQRIVLTRPMVTVEEDVGFLPGNLVSKMEPWTRPIFDIFQESYSKRDIDTMVQTGVIEISPLAYMRGRTFKNAFIIADEMQNSSPNQMMMVTTRIGTNTKMVITGDLKQSDRMDNNGLYDLIHRLKAANLVKPVPGIELVELSNGDIKRSEIVSTILSIYNPVSTAVPVIEPRPTASLLTHNTTIQNKSLHTMIERNQTKAEPNKMDCALIPLSQMPRAKKGNFTMNDFYMKEDFYC